MKSLRHFVFVSALLLAGLNSFGQQPIMKTINTIADLVRQNPNDINKTIKVLGYFSANDGGGGIFTVTNTASSINSGTRFSSTIGGKSWERIYENHINVRWFGAIPDDSTDDYAAITNAVGLAATLNYPLFVPGGTYRHTQTLNFGFRGLRVYGQGEAIFQAVGSMTNCVALDAGIGAYEYDTILENVTIRGSGVANQSGLYKRNTPHGVVRDVRVENVTKYGVHIQGDVLGLYENIVLSDENGSFGSEPEEGIRITSSDLLSFSTDCTFINITVEKGTLYGVNEVKADGMKYFGGTIEGLVTPGAVGLLRTTNSVNTTAIGLFFENNAGGDMVDYGNSGTFINCRMSSFAPTPPHSDIPGLTVKNGSYRNRYIGEYAYHILVESNALNHVFERKNVQNIIEDEAPESNLTEIRHTRQGGISETVFPGTVWVDWLRGRPIGGSGIFWGISHDVSNLILTNNTGHIQLNAVAGSAVKPNRLTVPGATDIQEGISLSAANSPGILGISQDNLDIGAGTISMLRLQSSIPINVTGIVGPSRQGQLLTVHNVGTNSIAFVQDDPASIETNRFASPARVLQGGESTVIQYDLLSQRWRAFGPFTDADNVAIDGIAVSDTQGVNFSSSPFDIELESDTGPSPDLVNVKFIRSATLAGNPTLLTGFATFGETGVVFEGTTVDAFEGLLTVADVTADRTWTLPNFSGTVAMVESIQFDGVSVTDALGVNLSSTPFDITLVHTTGSSPDVVDFNFARVAEIGSDPTLLADYATFGTTGVVFEGATANGFEGLLTAADVSADRTWTLPDKSGTVAMTSDITGGGTNSIALFLKTAKLPPSNPAALDTTEAVDRLLFDDTTEESVEWVFQLPKNYGGSPQVQLTVAFTSATSGNAVFGISVMAITAADNQDVTASSFDTEITHTFATLGTAGWPQINGLNPGIELTTNDSMAAGDFIRLKVARKPGHVSDTAAGDAELVGAIFFYANQ